MSDSDSSDVYDWPEDTPLGRKLATLEENLLCPICSGLFNNPHVLRCGHSYCSICIRKHFDAQLNRTSSDTCPSCREKADSFDLKKNGQLSNIVRAFRALRPNLLDLIKDANTSAEIEAADIHIIKQGAGGVAITRKLPFYSFHGLKKDKVKSTLVQLTAESKAQIRLDGDKDVLEKRVSAFLHLHNAQIGSDAPLSLDQVVKLVNYQETQMEKESQKSSRSAAKLEKVKNGEVVKEVENRFQDLAQKVREQKEAALRKIAATSETATDAPVLPLHSSSHPAAVNTAAPNTPHQLTYPNNTSHQPCNMATRAAESAQLVGFLEQRVDQGYDWGPWRVVMSRRLGRPFFYNSVTKIGQFAVPPELNVVPSPTQSQASQLDAMAASDDRAPNSDHGQFYPCHNTSGINHNWNTNEPNSSIATGAYGTGLSATSAVGSADNNHFVSADRNRIDTRTAERVMHYDHYLGEADEEESPFHMLWDSNDHNGHHVFDELDPSAFLLLEQSNHHSSHHSHGTSGASTALATATTDSSTALGGTAPGTAIPLPQSTPFPRGVASSNASSSNTANSALGTASHAGGPTSPWVVVDVETEVETEAKDRLTRSSQSAQHATQPQETGSSSAQSTMWACQACTYLNDRTTYTCDICGTVDLQVQQTFSRPLLRSGHLLITPAASNNSAIGRTQQRSGSQAAPQSQQSKLTGSKLKPPASGAKSNKKAKK